ncbi:hypothetical protein [Rhizobium lusitanum]|uniref:Uncharacterized protein n=1 Tax=Rhizobium lusitanum TaxID=293958 RepID=A0A7X0IX68_9HYPH|nr:hypothetical protein [Rhizobium lusitanum]MBB6488488.1 hypothetical protein [Rhizobium lusitanum]
MNFVPTPMLAVSNAHHPLTIDAITENPLFAVALRNAALKLIAMHDAAPRIVRYTADMKRWLLTQAILAFHFETVTDPTKPSLSAANLITFIADSKVASRNTATAHLAEMRNYRLLVDATPEGDKRVRPLRIVDTAEGLIREWFDEHLKSLDTLDQGTRYLQSAADHRLLWYAQPRMSRSLFGDPNWCEPPEAVDAFVRTASGSNILHDVMSRLSPERLLEPKMSIGPLRIGELAKRYIISRSHAQRVFVRARNLGVIGWELPGNGGNFWISEMLIGDHRRWQASKFAAIDASFHWALQHLRGGN